MRDQDAFFEGEDFKIDDKTKLPVLSRKLYTDSITSMDFFVEDQRGMKFLTSDGNKYYLLVMSGTEDCKLYESDGPTDTFALLYTFDASALSVSGLDFISSVFIYDKKIFVIASDSTGGDTSLFWSDDNGSTFTKVDISAVGDYVYDSVVRPDGVYLLTETGIWFADDGLAYISHYSFSDEVKDPIKMFYIDGFFYFSTRYAELFSVYKLGDSLEAERIYEGGIKADIFPDDDGGLYIFTIEDDYVVIKKYDSQVSLVKRFKISDEYSPSSYEDVYIHSLGRHNNKVYFSLTFKYNDSGYKNDCMIFSINQENFVLPEYKIDLAIAADQEWTFFHLYSFGTGFYLLLDSDPAKVYDDSYLERYRDTAEIVTSIIDTIDLIPRQVIVRHKPLADGASVKVYEKQDHASSWGSAIINSNTANSIRKTYDYAKGSKCDYLQFKIEINSTDDDVSAPEDVQLEFLYQESGMSKAK